MSHCKRHWQDRPGCSECEAELRAQRDELVEALRAARAKVRRIYDHYSSTEVARAVESKSGSQLCNYGEALAIMDAALAKVVKP